MTDVCLNCGAVMAGTFCSDCGQRHRPGRPSLLRLIGDALADLVDADSRLWRTLATLIFRPGRLARDYVAGKRARYTPPVRLYLSSSLLFFLLLSLQPDFSPVVFDHKSDTGVSLDSTSEAPSVGSSDQEPTSDTDAPGTVGVGINGDLASCNINYVGPWRDFLQPRIVSTCETAKLDRGRALLSKFIGYAPTAMFLIMPLFALSMTLFYWRPERFFIEHLMLQLYNHSAFFIVGTIGGVAEWLVPRGSAGIDVTLASYYSLYALQSLREYYGQSWLLTGLKFTVLAVVYLLLILLGLLLAGVATIIR